MADLRIAVFGGVRNDIQATEINPGQFASGQNFDVDPFGSLTKRKGISKIYADGFGNPVTGIADLITKWGKRKHVFVESLVDYIWADDPTIPFPGPISDDPAIPDPELDPDPVTNTGCCNYGGYCIAGVTVAECFDTYNGNFWKENGDCTAGSAVNCLHGATPKTVTGYTFTVSIPDISTDSDALVKTTGDYYWHLSDGASSDTWYVAYGTAIKKFTCAYYTSVGEYDDVTYTSGSYQSIALSTTTNVTFTYTTDAEYTITGTIKITATYD